MADFKEMKNSLKEIEKEVNIFEVREIKELVKECNAVLEDDVEEKDLMLKCETLYNELFERVTNKRKEINDVDKMYTTLSELTYGDNFTPILNKKKDNTNQVIDCINRVVERIKQLEITIYNNRIKELNNMKVKRYNVDLKMDIINNSMNILKEWSNKNTLNIVFDSKVDGDGGNNVLFNKVFNKSNLYFITSDENNNVYSGYVDTKINRSGGDWIHDKNAFIFSLIRNGKVINKRYFMKQGKGDEFILHYNNVFGVLYGFGDDINVCKVGSKRSWCNDDKKCYYDQNNDNKELTDITYPKKFVVQRIIVIEAN